MHAPQYVEKVWSLWCEFGNALLKNDGDVSLLRKSGVNSTLLLSPFKCTLWLGGGGHERAYTPYALIK